MITAIEMIKGLRRVKIFIQQNQNVYLIVVDEHSQSFIVLNNRKRSNEECGQSIICKVKVGKAGDVICCDHSARND
jgi:hypothetical protein